MAVKAAKLVADLGRYMLIGIDSAGGQAFVTNDDGLRRMRREDLGVIVLDDYV